MLPAQIANSTVVNNVEWTVPASIINDKPVYGWEGLLS